MNLPRWLHGPYPFQVLRAYPQVVCLAMAVEYELPLLLVGQCLPGAPHLVPVPFQGRVLVIEFIPDCRHFPVGKPLEEFPYQGSMELAVRPEYHERMAIPLHLDDLELAGMPWPVRKDFLRHKNPFQEKELFKEWISLLLSPLSLSL